MSKSLIIVESPSKAKTISKYLGKKFAVEASVGHIKNLPSKDLGVDIEQGFEPRYVTIRGKASVIKDLQKRAAVADSVYIATDPDREGEAIAWHIAKELEKQIAGKNLYRVLFNEITKSGIQEAMEHPRHIDERLVRAQQARRVMDRIVGYKVSPFLWKTIYKGLSAGRVQSVALRLICEREKEIADFVVEEYWTITSEFQKPGDGTFHTKLVKVDGEAPVIPDEATAQSLLERIRARQYAISDIQSKEISRSPAPPFITSSLQQEASNRLRFTTKRTMRVAQQLYEGVELGEEGAVGLITYMRTDSTRISNEALENVRSMIRDQYGAEYLPASARVFKVKAGAQDAHEAIRPTSMEFTPQRVRPHLSAEQYALYELIWKRFVASQMSPARMLQKTVIVDGSEFQFKGVGSLYTFRGFLQVYDDFAGDNQQDVDEEESIIPEGLAVRDAVEPRQVDPHQHFTKPPPRYSESSLVRELEANGVGRPSTYALIVSTIQDRGYVELNNRRFFATTLGMDVNGLLTTHFDRLFNVAFTSRMEQELDTIASGESSYLKVMHDFYDPFMELLNSVSPDDARLQEETDEICEKCQRPMIIRWGRNGKFLACSGYPECKNAKPLPGEAEKMRIEEKCPDCGHDLVLKQSRYGKFIGCSNYPECKFTRPITLGFACPKCKEGEVVARMTKTKRTFYGCTRYPDCDFTSWDKPVPQACPSCKNSYLLAKYTQKKGEFLKCPVCKEEFSKDLDPLDPLQVAA
ncbi:MAG: type I DNA topoisomerase [Bacteroidota bacterium]|jgi:DNA topoisomerase-1|nr:type I DNA topoisomerase [Bacteroidota bacterium]